MTVVRVKRTYRRFESPFLRQQVGESQWSVSRAELGRYSGDKWPIKVLESVRRDHAGLHSFRSMSLIEARRRNASALRLRFSQSLERRLHRPSHANVRSTTHRFGRATNPLA